jgi:GlpG protein
MMASSFGRQARPATIGLAVACLAGYVAAWGSTGALAGWLGLNTASPTAWGVATYPFTGDGNGRDLFLFLISLLWLFWIGGSLEPEIGKGKLVGLFMASAILGGMSLILASNTLGGGLLLTGPALALASLTVAWGVRHKQAKVLLWGILPLSGIAIAGLTVALTVFGYGTGQPLRGVFACLPLGFAALFALDRIPGLRYAPPVLADRKVSAAQLARERKFLEEVRRREKEREEQERLRKLLGE